MTTLLPAGEVLDVPERVIVAPISGVFEPATPGDRTDDGERVEAGQTIGTLRGPNSATPVTSPFAGFLIGMMATSGERLRAGEPIAWLRATQ
jgi:biotin carboxyl carrier protein